MFADRTTARIVGVLFIVATVTAIVGGVLVEEPLGILVEEPLKRSNALVDDHLRSLEQTTVATTP